MGNNVHLHDLATLVYGDSCFKQVDIRNVSGNCKYCRTCLFLIVLFFISAGCREKFYTICINFTRAQTTRCTSCLLLVHCLVFNRISQVILFSSFFITHLFITVHLVRLCRDEENKKMDT